jgi:hypothetical protein
MIQVVKFSVDLFKEWDDFVKTKSRNGCIFHERKFLSYHPLDRFKDSSVLVYIDSKLFAVVPTAIKDDVVISHPGSSAGGIIYALDGSLEKVLLTLDSVVEYYRSEGFKKLEFRLAEPIFSYPSDEELRYALWYRKFILEKEISSFVVLSKDRLWHFFGRKKNKTDINKLIREGYKVEITDNIEDCYDLILKNLDLKYDKCPTHSLEELSLLKSMYPDKIHFWLVKKGDENYGTFVGFVANDNVVHDFYIAKNNDYRNLNVMPYLFYSAFEYYQEKGIKYFNFGISSRFNWIKWNILQSKEKNGGRASVREVWRNDDLSTYVNDGFDSVDK